jgi:periplasmic protein TonB
MPLRCLLFSSNGEVRPPIWQVLSELGIEGEYCERAVDAVERVTTHLFQIVITDWEDQPEASFLLKTARDLKATHRPLTLAIVGNDAKVPEALQAGANSVLMKPIRVEQVRDTMSTACELLRSKQSFAAPTAPAPTPEMPIAAVAKPSAPTAAAAAPAPARVPESSEKTFRAGEFLTSSAPSPSAQFDTEPEVRVDQAATAEVEALTELEPMASSVAAQPAEAAEPQTPLTGWASLQDRLTRTGAKKAVEALKADAPKNELLTYGDMSARVEPASISQEASGLVEQPRETKAEAALFAYMEGERPEETAPPRKTTKVGGFLFAGLVAAACVALFAAPQARQKLQIGYRNVIRLGRNWLNPQPVPMQQVAPQHETFTTDEEYKLPVASNIPDATTDPSQIRVIPVIDPTVKPKNTDGKATQTAPDNPPTDQAQSGTNAGPQVPSGDTAAAQQATPSIPNASTSPNVATAATNVGVAISQPPSLKAPTSTDQPGAPRAVPPVTTLTPSVSTASTTVPGNAPTTSSVAIPSSLRSQLASSTPDASGAKPLEAAMAAIEPVNLSESATWGLLAQKVEPAYPDAAKASGQRGSVTMQVLIGRDGTVQDAKFLQGSLIFARSAIDAVKQWHFKPYLLNGRPASVQSTITLSFKP